jgi:hypothetical protein
MRRCFKAGIHYNNKINYNQITNKKTKEISVSSTDVITLNNSDIKIKRNLKGQEKYKNKLYDDDYY